MARTGGQRRIGKGFAYLGCVLFFLAGGALAGYCLHAAQHPGQASAGVFYGIGAFFLVMCWSFGFIVYRTQRAPKLRGLTLQVRNLTPRRGDTIDVDVAIGTRQRTGIQVGLVCRGWYEEKATDARGHSYPATKVQDLHATWNDLPALGDATHLRFSIPADAPFSYDGRVVSFGWSVEGRQVRRRRYDRRVATQLQVAP